MSLKTIRGISFLSIILCLTSCSNNTSNYTEMKIGDDISLLENVKLDYDNAFFDDFSTGVSKENWYIGKQAWGGSNGGVIPENIKYTDDGSLVIQANGAYYDDNDIRGVGDIKDGRYTGGALISKFLVQSGRYEIKMKVLPRQGACSAFWTFAYDTENALNHEIDIELPGGTRSNTISFTNVLNTNYITEQFSNSQDVNSETINGSPSYYNDGEWHTFRFDWYTNPEKVIYYVDGKISAISNVFVPLMQSRLWVGCWFPVTSAFVGTANFETDYMYVDYVKYIPFLDQPFTKFNPAVNGYAEDYEYPSEPISSPVNNKISNGDFDNVLLKNSRIGGWNATKRITEDKEIEEVCNVIESEGKDESKCLFVKDEGLAYQIIDSVYENFEHTLSFYGKGKGKVVLRYYGATDTEILEFKEVEVDSDNLNLHMIDGIAPKNTQRIRINVESSKGNTIYIDNVSLYQK